MTQSIVIRREGDRIVIEDVQVTTDYAGVLKTTYLEADAAISLFEAGLAIAREIARDETPRTLGKNRGVPVVPISQPVKRT